MPTRRWWRRVHWSMLATTAALVGIGILSIASASLRPTLTGEWVSDGYAIKQTVWLGISVIAAVAVLSVPYTRFAKAAPVFYAAGIALLLFVGVAGTTINGAKRWIDLGFTMLQPSELVKLAVIVMLAGYLRFRDSYRTWTGMIPPALVVGLPMLLILRQPDLGTAMALVPVALGLLYVAGARRRQILGLIAAGLLLAPLVYTVALKDYQRDRIIAFLDPHAFATTDGYHLIQSTTAVGAGQLTGVGYQQGTQNTLGYLPENHTDFIFAVIGEEWGFVGCTIVVALMTLLLVQIFLVAYRTREPFGRLLVVGVGILFTFQFFVNVGMTVGLMPITGLTLPLVSYGGSSLLSCFLGLALVQNVYARSVPVLADDDFHYATP